MYELKKIGKVFTGKFVVTGPSFYKKNLPGRCLAKVKKLCLRGRGGNRSSLDLVAGLEGPGFESL